VPSSLKPGTEVYSRVPESCRGTISEYALSTASTTALKPSTISHIQAASIPLASLTSLQALDKANLHFKDGLRGKTVYIPGGLSATGATAIQVAKNVFGAARVITTVSTAKMLKIESLLGKEVLDQIIDYTEKDPAKTIPAGSIDFMFDTMGQAMQSLHLMKRGGLILTVSGIPFGPELKAVAPDMPKIIRGILFPIGKALQYRAGRYGTEYHCVFMKPSAKDLKRMTEWIDRGKLKPVVGRVAELDNLQEVRDGCQEVFSHKGGVGKFVIQIDDVES
jgi:NADPH:quinone reductase-like Zn-dependent oxidoreductase